MSLARCRRLWQVEAARDGRISGQELAAFQEHAKTCADCGAEHGALDALMRALREDVSDDEVSLRRDRERLLERADQALRERDGERPPRRRPSVAVIVLAATTLLGIGTWTALRFTRDTGATRLATVTPSADANWKWQRTASGERVDLWSGALDIAVERTPADPPVTVHVPDGEIRDVGTVFSVDVRGGRTVRIAVRSGSVTFSHDGQTPFAVGTGAEWTPEHDRARGGEAVTSAAPLGQRAPDAPAMMPSVLARGARPPARPTTAAARALPEAGVPLDEDMAYLRIVALGREGRNEEARLAAAEYLRRFPNGFRKTEVSRFAAHSSP